MGDSDETANEVKQLRADLNDAVGFINWLAMQTKLEAEEAHGYLYALVELLISRGLLPKEAIEGRRARIKERDAERLARMATVHIDKTADKRALTDLPDIPCQELIPLCQGRCCTLFIKLSVQDLDEGKLKWDYKMPYILKRRSDGYCMYNDEQTRGCTAYDDRPATCRTYDCREDKRIWVDYAKRIPAPPIPEAERHSLVPLKVKR